PPGDDPGRVERGLRHRQPRHQAGAVPRARRRDHARRPRRSRVHLERRRGKAPEESRVPAEPGRRDRARRRAVLREATSRRHSHAAEARDAWSRRAAAILLATLAAGVGPLLFVNRSGLPRLAHRPRPFLRVTPAPPPIVTAPPGATPLPAVETVRVTLYFPDQTG